jgi:hypothetical protein
VLTESLDVMAEIIFDLREAKKFDVEESFKY